MPIKVEINLEAIEGLADCFRRAPKQLLGHLAKAYQDTGRYATDRVRSNVSAALKLTGRGAANSFRFKATSTSRATGFSKLFLDEYTRWKAADVFQTGGTISGKSGKLTIFTSGGRGNSGKRRFTASQLRNMILNKQARFVPAPRRILIVQVTGGFTKTGKVKKGSGKLVILGFLKKSVVEPKKLEFYETVEGIESIHAEYLEDAVQSTLIDIAVAEKSGG